MLLEFSVKNFGPFKDKATLSMQTTRGDKFPENTIPTPATGGAVLSSAIIFGANSSGKSYFIRAMLALKRMVGDVFEDGYNYPWYEPFRLSRESLNDPIEFNVKYVFDDGVFDYTVPFIRD